MTKKRNNHNKKNSKANSNNNTNHNQHQQGPNGSTPTHSTSASVSMTGSGTPQTQQPFIFPQPPAPSQASQQQQQPPRSQGGNVQDAATSAILQALFGGKNVPIVTLGGGPQGGRGDAAAAIQSLLQQNMLQQQQPPQQTMVTDGGNSLLINPQPPDTMEFRGESRVTSKHQSDDSANEILVRKLKIKYPRRYEDGASSWSCAFCKRRISLEGGERYWRCSECDEHAVCETCYAGGTSKQLHDHDGTLFYHKVQEPRWPVKTEMCKYTSSLRILQRCLCTYADRQFISQPFSAPGDNTKYSPVGDCHRRWYTYEQVATLSRSIACGLNLRGIKPRSVVGVCAENRLEWVVADFASLMGSMVFVPIQTVLPVSDLGFIIHESKINALFVSSSCLPSILEALKGAEGTSPLLVLLDDTAAPPEGFPTVTFQQLVKEGEPTENSFTAVSTEPSALSNILYTSGSTGRPKGVLFTEEKWCKFMKFPLTLKNAILYAYLPLSHTAGRSDIYIASFNGGHLYFPCKDSSRFFEEVKAFRPTAFTPVPRICDVIRSMYDSQLASLVNTPGAEPSSIKREARRRMRYVLGDRLSSMKVTSAPVTPKMKRFLRRTLKIAINEGYGSTEVGSIAQNGRVSVPLKLVSVPELGYSVNSPNPQGEIHVQRSNMRSDGYLNSSAMPEWFGTGDIGEWDGSFLRVIDRRTNVTKLSQGEFVELGRLELLYSRAGHVKSVFIYADSFKSSVVAIVLPRVTPPTRDSPSHTSDLTPPLEETILSEFHTIAKENSLRSYEVPSAVYVDYLTSEWTSADGLLTEANKVCRRAFVARYRSELDSLYVKHAIKSVLKNRFSPDISFSQLGGDSLSAVRVMSLLQSQAISVSYDELLNSPLASLKPTVASADGPVDISKDLESLHQHVKNELKSCGATQSTTVLNSAILTGATGFLGYNLLLDLLSQFPSTVIHCIVRSTNSPTPDRVSCLAKSDKRVQIIHGDMRLPHFGLSEEEFDGLCRDCDAIFHSASNVNHFLPYNDLYQSNVRPVYDIMSLAVRHKLKPVFFVSSSAVYSPQHLTRSGYSSSKWASDTLIQSCRSIMPSNWRLNVFRPALICGNTQTGEVNTKDWLQRFLLAVSEFKLYPPPSSLCESRNINMVPVDYCTKVILQTVTTHFNPPAPSTTVNNASTSTATDTPAAPTTRTYSIAGMNVGIGTLLRLLQSRTPDSVTIPTYSEWYTQMCTMAGQSHPVSPFLERFRLGLPYSSQAQLPPETKDTHSLVPFVPLTDAQVLRSLDFLLRNH
ncbi:long-chain fatty-acid-CoA ligase FadD9 [Pelomyxa schiedti]|nr:long-chain fatty-acid-CoA ligase FadD9 [Pelomyxa schiedti]